MAQDPTRGPNGPFSNPNPPKTPVSPAPNAGHVDQVRGTNQQAATPSAQVGRPAVVDVTPLDPIAAVRGPLSDHQELIPEPPPTIKREPDLLAAAKKREAAGGKGDLVDYLSPEERAWFNSAAPEAIKAATDDALTRAKAWYDNQKSEAQAYKDPEERGRREARAMAGVDRVTRRTPPTPFFESRPASVSEPPPHPPNYRSTIEGFDPTPGRGPQPRTPEQEAEVKAALDKTRAWQDKPGLVPLEEAEGRPSKDLFDPAQHVILPAKKG